MHRVLWIRISNALANTFAFAVIEYGSANIELRYKICTELVFAG